MAFEFILLALIEGRASVEVSRYEDAKAYYCLQDATKLNSYIRNQYVKVEDLSSVKEMFLNRVSDYEKKYGPFLSFTEGALNFGTPDSEAFYQGCLARLTRWRSNYQKTCQSSNRWTFRLQLEFI